MDQERLVRDEECREITGLSRATRRKLTERGEFPSPVLLSGKAGTHGARIAWRLSELLAWIGARERVYDVPEAAA